MLIWSFSALLAVIVGISLGLLGGGGGVLVLPVLVYVMGIPTKSAIAMTLVIIGAVSVLSVIPHWRRGHVHLKTALTFGSATMVGAFLGARIAVLPIITDTFQMLLFALMMLLAAGLMVHRSLQQSSGEDVLEPPFPLNHSKFRWLWLMLEGLAVGLLTGFVGVGGGFAIIPALVLLAKVPMRQAIGTSLLIIALNAVAGLLGYLGKVPIDWAVTVSFTLAAGSGALLGSYLGRFVSVRHLQRSFGYLLLVLGVFVLLQNRSGFQQTRDTASLSRALSSSIAK